MIELIETQSTRSIIENQLAEILSFMVIFNGFEWLRHSFLKYQDIGRHNLQNFHQFDRRSGHECHLKQMIPQSRLLLQLSSVYNLCIELMITASCILSRISYSPRFQLRYFCTRQQVTGTVDTHHTHLLLAEQWILACYWLIFADKLSNDPVCAGVNDRVWQTQHKT